MKEAADLPPGLGLKTLPHRFLIAYTFLYMLPFPLDLAAMVNAIPWFQSSFLGDAVQSVIGLHGRLTGPLVQFIGAQLLGQEVSLEVNGSGDSLASYLDVLLDASLALFLAFVWWAWRRSTPISPRVSDLNRVFLRYLLFTNMIGYGLVKLIPGGQFPAPGPDRLLQPFGEASPMGLLWTFMGASTGYQMFTGAAEVLGGLLLLFRRTTLLGSLVVAAAMANVFVLNLCYDVPVKLFSFHLLLFALVLAAPDAGRLFALFVANKPVPPGELRAPWPTTPRFRGACLVLKLVFVILFFGQYIGSGKSWLAAGQEAFEHPLRGIYQVESFTGEAKPWVRVGMTPPYSITILRSDGSTDRLRLQLDMEASELAIFERGTPKPTKNPMRFELEKDRLLVQGEFEGQQITVKLRRDQRESLLTGRGLRWVSEAPFNR